MKPILVWLIIAALTLTGCASRQASNVSETSPDAALQAYTQLGLQYLQVGDTANAKISLQRALSLSERYAPANNAMALVFQSEREDALAERYFKRAAELDSGNAMIHNNYGAFLFAQSRFEEACKQFSKATEDPFYTSRAQSFENLGQCYRQTRQLTAAEHAYRRALDLSRNRPIAMAELADLLLEQDKNTEAAQWFNRFRELVDARRAQHTARSLWVGVRIARMERNAGLAATYGLLLRNLYPDSDEYRMFKESAL
ncbi:type IV pilus biogenesis/stability protein PilW [Nitrincola tapanii]|uniref:Type IV pilus biogenesis/stability protein PilW n=1 Tax=Nitrincola tapanii TaxID=1708751 RepID=A0A5A9W7C7_9GAMM|nr:type IV pilus biogenesis/stability protein PilW [Nitrincola tapanii]KAA0876636.1 type IV pilus biogenesis/stability protein PilW [Nitrincola tapanii]